MSYLVCLIITKMFSFLFPSVQADEGFQVEVVHRLQCKDLSWTWIYIRANKNSESQTVSCTNFIIRYDKLTFFSTPEMMLYENVYKSTTDLIHCFALVVKQRPDFFRRKSAVMPSSPPPSRRPTLRAPIQNALKGRGRLTAKVRSQVPK